MDSKVIASENYAIKLQSALYKQYQNGEFCDVILVTGFGPNETR